MINKFFYKISHWETWHYLAKYIPLAPIWLWYCCRARSFWFFTPVNPTIEFGGFEGETKREMYDQLPASLYPASIYIDPEMQSSSLEKLLADNDILFPLAVKPDKGMMGFMFRKIAGIMELIAYHERMPTTYIIQQLIDYPLEVSVFYYRFPGEQRGTITGFIKKEFLQVIGDGVSTVNDLIDNYSRASFRLKEMKSKHAGKLDTIIPAGTPYILSYALNLSRGGKLISLEHEKDDRLLKVFDDISHYTKHFYYGRYDIKCASIESLKNGKDFSILEFNGTGAEPHHIYGNGNNLFQAYAIILRHWKVLFQISVQNRRTGIKCWSYKKGKGYLNDARAHFKILKQLDLETNV